MSIFSGVFAYVMIWWLVLFAVLPWGAHSYHETGETKTEGAADSAPVKPRMWRKIAATSVISAALWLVWFAALELGVFAQLFGL